MWRAISTRTGKRVFEDDKSEETKTRVRSDRVCISGRAKTGVR